MVRIIDTEADLLEGLSFLAASEPRFAVIAARLGLPPLRRQPPGFAALLRIITEQMLSFKAADAIWRRIESELSPIAPASLLRRRDQTLIRLGLSRAKAKSFKALAKAVAQGAVELDRFAEMSDREIMEQLLAVAGIGRWTAEVYLLSHMGRSDVWPAGDLALQAAVHDAFALDRRPNEAGMRALSKSWQPWRAVAARLLWAHYRSLRNMPQAVA